MKEDAACSEKLKTLRRRVQKDAVLLEAGQVEPVGSAPGDDLGCTLA
jgi:hypothetical protein